MNKVLEKLSTGDLRSEEKSEEVAFEIIEYPPLLSELLQGLQSDIDLIRARCCMTMEIISRHNPELLEDVLPQLIDLASREKVAQARWHLAEIFENIVIPDGDVEDIIRILLVYLNDKSRIVKYRSVKTLGVLGQRSKQCDNISETIQKMADESRSMEKKVAKAIKLLRGD
jgi:hypothetical protein